MFGKSKKTKKEKDPSEKKKLEWDLSDGLHWNDFVGIFVMLAIFIWRLIRLILSPAFWIYGENIRMLKFARNRTFERVLNDDERWFVETVPALYTLTGLIGGILVGIFAVLQFQDILVSFFKKLSVEFVQTVFNTIGAFFGAIFYGIVIVIQWIGGVLSWIVSNVIAIFQLNPFLALGGLLVIGFLVMFIYISIMETGFFNGVTEVGRSFLYWLIGSPDRFRLRVNSFYRRMNHRLMVVLVGKERLHTRTQIYFKRVVLYSFLLSVWSLISGIFIGIKYSTEISNDWTRISFIAVVLLFAGVISGTIFFAFVARLLDFYSRRKYIAPEFINEETVEQEAMNKYIQEEEQRISKILEVPEDIMEHVSNDPMADDDEEVKPKKKSKSKAKTKPKDDKPSEEEES